MVGRLESKGKTTFIRGSIVICLFACLCNIVGWSTLLKLVRKKHFKKKVKKNQEREMRSNGLVGGYAGKFVVETGQTRGVGTK
jgi:hypothetical protein